MVNATGASVNANANGASRLTLGLTMNNQASTTSVSNVFATEVFTVQQASTVNSLTLDSGGGTFHSGGNLTTSNCPTGLDFGLNGTLNTLTLTTGTLLANTGNVGLTGGSITAAAAPLRVVAQADITLGTNILGTGGIVKDGAGIATLTGRSFNTGATTVNNGTLKLGSANALLVVPTSGAPTVANLNANGGTFDLNGNNQAVGQITQTTGNFAANSGGAITNSSGAAATLYTNTGGAVTSIFAGTLTGALSLDKSGTNVGSNLVLVSAGNSYTGTTTIRGGTLVLQDSGTITGGGQINVNYTGGLHFKNDGLSHVASRTGSSAISLNAARSPSPACGRRDRHQHRCT